MKEDLKNSAALLRHQLASIDISDLIRAKKFYEELSEEVSKDLAAQCETFYNQYFKKRLLYMQFLQQEFIAKEAVTDLQLQFARGTFNGLQLIKEWMELEVAKSLSRFDKPQTDLQKELGEV